MLSTGADPTRANALADAEAVIALRRPWTKGHFRRARALVGLGRFEEAHDAIIDGLQFEPEDKVRLTVCVSRRLQKLTIV
jgi:translocation protein SEC72